MCQRPALSLSDVLAASPGGWSVSVILDALRPVWVAHSPAGGVIECGSAVELLATLWACEREAFAGQEEW